MSLSICVYTVEWDDKTGECHMEDMNFSRPSGAENWRHLVYGSAEAKSLGLKVLPSLTKRDIYAGGEELEQLEQDVKIMKENLHLFGDTWREDIAKRLDYILEAIRHAKSLDAEVVIW